MNVQEVERETGLTRANIRFYEKQGLLRPNRKANGYRDYSSDDVNALLKIKLMRELDVSIEEIDKLQREERNLSSVIEERAESIDEERGNLSDAKIVCQSIGEDGITFRELEAEKYLEELEQLAKERGAENAGQFRRKQDILRETLHPWRRYFARMIDGEIYIIAISVFFYLMFHIEDSIASIVFLTVLGMAAMIIVESVLLSCFGTTAGKWLFGIRVLSKDGKRLTWREAAERTGMVLWHGLAFGIPLWSEYRLYKSYDAYTDGENLAWDENCLYLIDEKKGLRYVAAVAAVVLLLVLETVFEFPSEQIYKMPMHYDGLTVEEFAENYNKYLEVYGLADEERLNRNGEWEEPQALKPRFRYELEDGIIKNVSFEIDYTGKEENPHYRDEVTCAALAWEGGKWKSKMRMMMSDRLLRLEDEIQESGCGNYKAYDIRQDIVEVYRYEEKDGGFYPQMSGEDGRLHIVFEMGEKIRE